MSIRKPEGSGVLIGGGGGGGGVEGGGPFEGGTELVGIPGEDGVPPMGKSGGMIGTKMDPGDCCGTMIAVVGGTTSGNSGDDSEAGKSPPSAGSSIASGEGSLFNTGATGPSEIRFPQRVLAMCSPSVNTVSPAGRFSRFFVQKIRLPTR